MTRVPVRKRRTFMLTPLVDVMFLVLIFFMLSSQTGRYGLLSIVPPARAETDAAAAVPAVADPAGAELVVTIGPGAVRIGGRSIATNALPGALSALRSAGYEHAVLLTTTAASVQDVVSVLEAFESARFARTRLVREAGVAP
ncbi:ExbD/TolR family protein [Devosia nitrariae]|uniref:Biopolymer transport protein ExbD n=1 Tax=Devosia nitrariae TaxID=2071872 RepID=A0ABQ5WDQ6_9HYPH|nr:biopolymer transporter ExbD [Devosia nitrariae]GLQ58023.1 hypothetical protein GCM10010862_52820 [Devosia nitrariae]